MANDGKIYMSAKVLPDVIKKHFTGMSTVVTPATANEKWYYKTTLLSSTSADLIAGSFLGANAGTTSTSSPAAITTSDKVRFLFIKHSGTTDGTTVTSESINLCFDGGTAAYNLADSIEIGPGEAFYCKCPNTTVGNLHAAVVDTNMNDVGSAGEGNVQCFVAALIDDV
tara:strand:- start:78 stop:584 length:507 start_codon:yes stop_codon:yes gene_type:complete